MASNDWNFQNGEEMLEEQKQTTEKVEKLKDLKQEEQQLLDGVFSQDDADRQQEINQKIDELEQATGVKSEELGGPTRVDEKTGITVEDQENNAVDEIRQKDKAQEAQKNIENQQEFIKEKTSPDDQVKVNGEKVSQEEALTQLEQNQKQAQKAEKFYEARLKRLRNPDTSNVAPEAGGLYTELARQNQQRQQNQEEEKMDFETAPARYRPRSGPPRANSIVDEPGKDLLQIGVGIMDTGQKVSDATLGRVTDAAQSGVGSAYDFYESMNIRGGGNYAFTQDTGFQPVNTPTPSKEKAQETAGFVGGIGEGTATLGTQVVGLGVAATGGTITSFRSDTPGLFEGIAAGPSITGQGIRRQGIADFAAEETGEELGEALVGAAIFGPAGLALGATPTPEVEPELDFGSSESFGSSPDKSNPSDLTDARREDLPDLGESNRLDRNSRPNREEQALLDQAQAGRPENSRSDVVNEQGLTETEVKVIEERTDSEITENEFTETGGVKQAEQEEETGFGELKRTLKDQFINPDAFGIGPAALVPPEVEVEQEPETVNQPDTGFGADNTFDTEQSGSLNIIDNERETTGGFNNPTTETSPGLDSEVGLGIGAGLGDELSFGQGQTPGQPQSQDPGFQQDQPEEFEFDQPQTQVPGQEPPNVNVFDLGFADPSFDPEQQILSDPETDFTPDNTPESGGGNNENGFSNIFNQQQNNNENEEETRFASSLTGQIFNIERTREGEDPVFTGLEIRGETDNADEDGNLQL